MQTNYHSSLQGAMLALKQNQFLLAASYFDKLTAIMSSNPQLLKPAIVAYINSGNHVKAKQLLPSYLKICPKDAGLHNVFADLQKKQGDFILAEKHFLIAISLSASTPAFRYNLALMYFQNKKFSASKLLLKKNIELPIPHEATQALYLKVLFELGLFREANNQSQFISENYPQLINKTEYIKYLILIKIQTRNFSQANKYLNNLKDDNSNINIFERACLLFITLKQSEHAITTLQTALTVFPTSIILLNLYTSLSHELRLSDPLLYWHKIEDKSWSLPLIISYVKKLLLFNQAQNARKVLKSHQDEFSRAPDFWCTLAEINQQLNDYESTITLDIEKPMLQKSTYFIELLVKANLAMNNKTKALQICKRLHSENQGSQYLNALYASCLRAEGNPLYHDFYDYNHLVLSTPIEQPLPYKSLNDFNHALVNTLNELHIMKASPLSQSVTDGGTQTPGFLFDNESKTLVLLKNALETAWSKLITSINFSKLSKNNPLYAGLTGELEFKTAWSIENSSGGFHLPHVHSKGPFSGVYYVDVPEQISQVDEKSDAGFLGFGKPDLPILQDYDYKLKPIAGQLIIFPSYFWHGTLPFKDNGKRLVVAFDLNYKNN
jgi:hypothetical protein